MARLNLPTHPAPYVDRCSRALGARKWHRSMRGGFGNWWIDREDVARLRWIIGATQAKQVLRHLRFELQPDYSWQTFDGPSQPFRLTINPKTWSLLSSIARCYGREDHPLSLAFSAVVKASFAPDHNPQTTLEA